MPITCRATYYDEPSCLSQLCLQAVAATVPASQPLEMYLPHATDLHCPPFLLPPIRGLGTSVAELVDSAEGRGRVAKGEHALEAWRPCAACWPEVCEAQVLRLDEEVPWVLLPLPCSGWAARE